MRRIRPDSRSSLFYVLCDLVSMNHDLIRMEVSTAFLVHVTRNDYLPQPGHSCNSESL
jgi:hypothetical protein